ncbi:hypothetical protein [Neisseria sp. Ec49-e6-T10]|uniref:hypothetical protein n=1 Tax=Neisseria sp. Ec49-e6-T10 TaxID=3140744 RepID=UPI003EBD1FAD
MIATKDFNWLLDGKVLSFKKGAPVDLPEKEIEKAKRQGLLEAKKQEKKDAK